MQRSKQPPRLSRHEIRELGKVANSLMSVHESLQHTNWAGATTSAAIVGQAIELIAKVWVRCRQFLPEVQRELDAAAREATQQSEAAVELPGENGTAAIDGQEG